MLKSFIISFMISLLLILACGYLAGENRKAYEACVNAGIQSNETCYYYTMQ